MNFLEAYALMMKLIGEGAMAERVPVKDLIKAGYCAVFGRDPGAIKLAIEFSKQNAILKEEFHYFFKKQGDQSKDQTMSLLTFLCMHRESKADATEALLGANWPPKFLASRYRRRNAFEWSCRLGRFKQALVLLSNLEHRKLYFNAMGYIPRQKFSIDDLVNLTTVESGILYCVTSTTKFCKNLQQALEFLKLRGILHAEINRRYENGMNVVKRLISNSSLNYERNLVISIELLLKYGLSSSMLVEKNTQSKSEISDCSEPEANLNSLELALKRKQYYVAKFLLTDDSLIDRKTREKLFETYKSVISENCCIGLLSLVLAKFLWTNKIILQKQKSQLDHSHQSIVIPEYYTRLISLAFQNSRSSKLKQERRKFQISIGKPNRTIGKHRRSKSEPRINEFINGVPNFNQTYRKFQKLRSRTVSLENCAEMFSANDIDQTKRVEEINWVCSFLKENNLLKSELRNSCCRITQKMILLDSSSKCRI